MATKAQVLELQRQISNLQWELEKKDKAHQDEIDELVKKHNSEIEELKNGMMPMTKNDVINLIKENLKIHIEGGYNGYVEGSLYFDDECIDSSSDYTTDDSNPMDE